MTLSTTTEDPCEFSFEIMNEEKDVKEILYLNVVEIVTYLSMHDKITDDVTVSPADQVEAIRACARPAELVKRLSDHVLVAKLATATMKLEQLGKEPGSPPTLPTPTASASVHRGSPQKNMSPV